MNLRQIIGIGMIGFLGIGGCVAKKPNSRVDIIGESHKVKEIDWKTGFRTAYIQFVDKKGYLAAEKFSTFGDNLWPHRLSIKYDKDLTDTTLVYDSIRVDNNTELTNYWTLHLPEEKK